MRLRTKGTDREMRDEEVAAEVQAYFAEHGVVFDYVRIGYRSIEFKMATGFKVVLNRGDGGITLC